MAGYIADSKRTDWNTPVWILDRVRRGFRGQIDLDPCCNARCECCALRRLIGDGSEAENGLNAKNWRGVENIFVNPPFGKDLDEWCRMCAIQSPHYRIMLLLPAAVDTQRWHDFVWHADAICFFKGRLQFTGADASAPMAMAMAYWGPTPPFMAAFHDVGRVVRFRDF
jgi:hypothetical protein